MSECVGERNARVGDGDLLALGDRGTLGGRQDELRVDRVLLVIKDCFRHLCGVCKRVRDLCANEGEGSMHDAGMWRRLFFFSGTHTSSSSVLSVLCLSYREGEEDEAREGDRERDRDRCVGAVRHRVGGAGALLHDVLHSVLHHHLRSESRMLQLLIFVTERKWRANV